jgi:twitching motility protein PilT
MVPGDRSRELAAQLSFSLRYVISQKLIPRTDGRGRVPAMEVLRNTSSVANMIRTSNWAQIYSALETKRKEGMNTLEQHLIQLCETGEISREDAIAHANDPVIIDRLGK